LIHVNRARRNICHAPLRYGLALGREDEVKHEGEIPRQPRRDRMIHERVHDAYKTRLKLPEPTVCPQCRCRVPQGALAVGAAPGRRT
jgi:hypothetical protein